MRRFLDWLRFGRMRPGEWRAIPFGDFRVRYSGEAYAIIQAAKFRFPAFEEIQVEAIAPEYWRVKIRLVCAT
jgi:hypothetical protein